MTNIKYNYGQINKQQTAQCMNIVVTNNNNVGLHMKKQPTKCEAYYKTGLQGVNNSRSAKYHKLQTTAIMGEQEV